MSVRRGDAEIAAQIAYYRERAPEYDATFAGAHDPALVGALAAFAPRGDVLELAAGTGAWTEALVAHPVTSLLAVDAAPEMLAFHERRIGDQRVTRVVADLFAWTPPRRFDVVSFAFWLSHVPPGRFDAFWQLVGGSLAPSGRVCFADQDDRAAWMDEIGGDADYPTASRPLVDGRTMTAIKVYHEPAALEARLRRLGWEVEVRAVGDGYLWGAGARSAGRRAGEPGSVER